MLRSDLLFASSELKDFLFERDLVRWFYGWSCFSLGFFVGPIDFLLNALDFEPPDGPLVDVAADLMLFCRISCFLWFWFILTCISFLNFLSFSNSLFKLSLESVEELEEEELTFIFDIAILDPFDFCLFEVIATSPFLTALSLDFSLDLLWRPRDFSSLVICLTLI